MTEFRAPMIKGKVAFLPYDREPTLCKKCKAVLVGHLNYYSKVLPVTVYRFQDGWRYGQIGLKTQYHHC